MELDEISRSSLAPPDDFEIVDPDEQVLNGLRPPPSSKATLERTDSDLSLYAPMRRRSLLQTPGVATRPERAETHMSIRSSFRQSHPPVPLDSGLRIHESGLSRRLSMPSPAPSLGENSCVQAVTPGEMSYRQLGDISFGSLRITNGAPVQSPANDLEPRLSWLATAPALPSSLRREQPRRNSSPVGLPSPCREHESLPWGMKIAQPRPISPLVASFRRDLQIADTPSPNEPAHGSVKEWPFILAAATDVSGPNESLPTLEVLSKQTEHDDALFDDDDSGQEEPYPVHVAPPTIKESSESLMPLGKVTRSDSGFASTTSSKSVRTPLSNTDSGYSSSHSLHSVKGGQSSPKEITPPLPQLQSFKFPFGMQQVNMASPVQISDQQSESGQQLGCQNVDLALAIQSTSRPVLPGYRGVTPTTRPSRPTTMVAPEMVVPGQTGRLPTWQSRSSRNEPHDEMWSPPRSAELYNSEFGFGTTKSGKLQRLIGGSTGNRRKLVSKRGSRDMKVEPSLSPVDMHGDPSSYYTALQSSKSLSQIKTRASRDTLTTILSVGSAELDQMVKTQAFVKKTEAVVEVEAQVVPVTPSARRRRSLQSILYTRKSNARNSGRGPREAVDMDSDFDEDLEDILGEETRTSKLDRIRSIGGHSAFDQAFAAMTDDRSRNSHMKGTRPGPTRRQSTRQAHPRSLRSRASAPDFHYPESRPLSPLLSDGASESTIIVPPPPVSMRMRSLKSTRKQNRRSRRGSTDPEGERQPPTWSSHAGQPPQARTNNEFPRGSMNSDQYAGKPNQHQRSSHGEGRPPPPSRTSGYGWPSGQQPHQHRPHQGPGQFPTPSHQEWNRPYISKGSHGSHQSLGFLEAQPRAERSHQEMAPYRVLHSYDSPAYRNTPIWG